MKLEKTCRCIESVELDSHKFLEHREYQVDILVEHDSETYIVYQGGGEVRLGEEEFTRYFEEIE